jgi:chromosome segregation ATPase
MDLADLLPSVVGTMLTAAVALVSWLVVGRMRGCAKTARRDAIVDMLSKSMDDWGKRFLDAIGEVKDRIKELCALQDDLRDEAKDISQRVTKVETRLDAVEDRLNRHFEAGKEMRRRARAGELDVDHVEERHET